MAKKPTYKELEQRVKYLESAFHHAPDAIVTLDPSHRVLEWNPGAQKIFGYSGDEARGRDLDDLVSRPDVEQEAHDNTSKVLSGQPLKPVESVRYRKDGTSVQVIASGAPIIIDNILKGVVAMYTDITDRKKAEEALRESEEKYRTVLEANPDPVVVYDIDGKVVYFNPAFTGVFGWSMEERLGEKNDAFVPEGAWRETKMMIDKVLAGERFSGIETFRYNKKGEIIPVSISGATYKDQNDNPIGSIINLRDISDQKRMEAQLQQSQKMEAIGTLAGGIAHDFNNILSGILGNAQLAELQIDEPIKAKKNIHQIVNNAQRAAALVRQILIFSRQSEYKKKPLKVFLLLKEALDLLRSTIPSNIEIKENIFSKAKIMGDSTQIHQVIINLCTNAYHAMSDSGGVLTVGLQEIEVSEKKSIPDLNMLNGKYLKLEVSDTGHGIDAQILGKIFDPYFTTKEMGKGTGLGLAVVDGIVKNHDGFIKSYSGVGNGATFQVVLPVIE